MAQIRQQLRKGKLKMAEQRYGAGGVPYVGRVGEQGEATTAPEALAKEQPTPEVKVDVTETETPGDIPQG
jgi:hypothetical protein